MKSDLRRRFNLEGVLGTGSTGPKGDNGRVGSPASSKRKEPGVLLKDA